MKKYLIHIIYLLVIAFFVVYANIKANEADKQAVLAAMNAEEAEIQAQNASRQAEIAVANAAEAKIQERLSQDIAEQLRDCQFQKN